MASGPDPGSEEAALIARLRAGDERAYSVLVRTQGGRMLSVARRYLPEEDARDAVQDAFVSAFRAIDRFEGKSRLSTWLHRIVVNAALMKLRSRERRPERPIEELLPRFLEDGHHVEPPADWEDGVDHKLERSETRALVRERIESLPESYRTVLMLRDIEELDTAETARLLEISPNAVKIRLHRARQALRELLNADFRKGTLE